MGFTHIREASVQWEGRMNEPIYKKTTKQNLPRKSAKVLVLALLRVRITPRSKDKLNLFQILYRRSFQVVTYKPYSVNNLVQEYLQNYVLSLGKVLSSINRYLQFWNPVGLDHPVHNIQLGDWVYLKSWNDKLLKEHWR